MPKLVDYFLQQTVEKSTRNIFDLVSTLLCHKVNKSLGTTDIIIMIFTIDATNNTDENVENERHFISLPVIGVFLYKERNKM